MKPHFSARPHSRASESLCLVLQSEFWLIESSSAPLYISLCFRTADRHRHSWDTEMTAYLSMTQLRIKTSPSRCSDIIQNAEDSGDMKCGVCPGCVCRRRQGCCCVVMCVCCQHSARFYPTGAAHRTEPCSHWRRRRGEEGGGVVLWKGEKKQFTPLYTKKKRKKKKKGWLTLCFDGITPTEWLYGNTCQRDGLFPFTSSDSPALIRLCDTGPVRAPLHTQFSAWFSAISHSFSLTGTPHLTQEQFKHGRWIIDPHICFKTFQKTLVRDYFMQEEENWKG